MGSPYDPGAWHRLKMKMSFLPFGKGVTISPELMNEAMWSNAEDPWQGQEPDEREDPGPSAVDRGQGLPTYNAKNGERMVDTDGSGTIHRDPPPEVLAQLQRIEDILTKIWRATAPTSESDVNVIMSPTEPAVQCPRCGKLRPENG